jgi:hypothetical protein
MFIIKKQNKKYKKLKQKGDKISPYILNVE